MCACCVVTCSINLRLRVQEGAIQNNSSCIQSARLYEGPFVTVKTFVTYIVMRFDHVYKEIQGFLSAGVRRGSRLSLSPWGRAVSLLPAAHLCWCAGVVSQILPLWQIRNIGQLATRVGRSQRG